MLKPFQRMFHASSSVHTPAPDGHLPITLAELAQGRRAHRDWHHHLVACLTGRSSEVLHPEEICFDDRCAFAHWLQAMGEKKLGGAGYAALCRHHKLVHLHAANVVSFRLGGQVERARILFRTGYADASRALLQTLESLEMQCQPHPSTRRSTRGRNSRLKSSEAPATT
jgi:hypothetical protein